MFRPLLLPCLFLLLSACKKERLPPVGQTASPEITCEQPDTNWVRVLHPDSLFSIGITPVVYGDQVLFSSWHDYTYPEVLRMFDAKTGEMLWEWDDYVYPYPISRSSSNVLRENIFYFSTLKEIYGFDLDRGQPKWVHILPEGVIESRMIVHEDALYAVLLDQYTASTSAHLIKAELPTTSTSWDTLYSHYMKDGLSPYFEPPVIWKNQNKERVLLVKESFYHFETHEQYFGLSAYNEAQDSFLWRYDSLDITTTTHPPVIVDNRVYFVGYRNVFCLDIPTGTILWKHAVSAPQTMATSNILAAGDRLIVNMDDRNMYALDRHTGVVLWHATDGGGSCQDMVLYKGHVYYTCYGSRKVEVAAIETGRHYSDDCPFFDGTEAINEISIDPQTQRLFVTGVFHGLAIDLE